MVALAKCDVVLVTSNLGTAIDNQSTLAAMAHHVYKLDLVLYKAWVTEVDLESISVGSFATF